MPATAWSPSCLKRLSARGAVTFRPEREPEESPVTPDVFERFFPRVAGVRPEHVRITNVGLYSVIPPAQAMFMAQTIAAHLGQRSDGLTAVDATANVGGQTLAFAASFKHVHAVELMPLHCEILRHNVAAYGVTRRVSVHCGDFFKLYRTLPAAVDVIFFDPPWGGPDYRKQGRMSLNINNVNIMCIAEKLLLEKRTRCVAVRTPATYSFNDVHALLQHPLLRATITRVPFQEKQVQALVILDWRPDAGRPSARSATSVVTSQQPPRTRTQRNA